MDCGKVGTLKNVSFEAEDFCGTGKTTQKTKIVLCNSVKNNTLQNILQYRIFQMEVWGEVQYSMSMWVNSQVI